MAKTEIKEMEEVNSRTKHLMEESPVWRSLLKMAIPSLVMMLILGGYVFVDNVLAIQFAPDSYGGSKDIVRMGMSAFTPINSFITAFAMLFGMGISTRVSINLGAKRMKRAKNTLKTGTMSGMSIAIILIPILIFAAKPWMASQFESGSASTLSSMGFDYGWIIIMLIPFTFFNQILGGLFRTEGRMKAMMLPMVASIGVNLLFDWIFMGPLGMGIEGGAWATFISTVMVTVIYLVIIIKNKSSIIRLKNLFGFKFRLLSVIGIILVGLSPFLRNFAQSITQTVEMNVIKDVSGNVYEQKGQIGYALSEYAKAADIAGALDLKNLQGLFSNHDFQVLMKAGNADAIYKYIDVYASNLPSSIDANQFTLFSKSLIMAGSFNHDLFSSLLQVKDGGLEVFSKVMIPTVTENQMTLILTGVFPIFALFFPTMFSFAQAGRPIASYNFGAKNLSRVKEAFWWTVLFSSITGLILYFVATFALNYPLMSALGVSDTKDLFGAHESTAYRATQVLRIMMISMPMFGFAIGAMILTGSTDRVIQSIFISSMRGIIYFFPAIFIFKAISAANPGNEFLFWWFYPVLSAAAVVSSMVIAFIVLRHLDKKVTTLDDKLSNIYSKIENRTWLKRKAK